MISRGKIAVLRLFFKEMPSRYASRIANARLTVDKDTSLADEPFCLSISGLEADQNITLHTSVRLPNAAIFESSSHYIADGSGSVELTRDESHGGSFKGVEPMGPLSFMVPSAVNKKKYERFLIKDPTQPFAINFHVLDSFVNSLDEVIARNVHGTLPNLTISRIYMRPGVEEIPVWNGRVRGTLYIPAGDGPFPGVISMSGGYPGAMKHKAALLASRGFAAIALKYFGEDDLPDDLTTVDLDYVEEAAVFLRNHAKVDGRNGVGVVANCFSATIGLGLAAVAPKGLISSVVSINGWFFLLGDFSYKGETLPLPRQTEWHVSRTVAGITEWKYDFIRDDDSDFRRAEESALAFYKRHDVAFMFVTGSEDAYMPTGYAVKVAEHILRTYKHPNYEILHYEGAGHLIEHPFYPLASVAWTFREPHSAGGKQPGHSIAQNDSWPKILEFTRKNLTWSKKPQSQL